MKPENNPLQSSTASFGGNTGAQWIPDNLFKAITNDTIQMFHESIKSLMGDIPHSSSRHEINFPKKRTSDSEKVTKTNFPQLRHWMDQPFWRPPVRSVRSKLVQTDLTELPITRQSLKTRLGIGIWTIVYLWCLTTIFSTFLKTFHQKPFKSGNFAVFTTNSGKHLKIRLGKPTFTSGW